MDAAATNFAVSGAKTILRERKRERSVQNREKEALILPY
jgi:hypothetical protein